MALLLAAAAEASAQSLAEAPPPADSGPLRRAPWSVAAAPPTLPALTVRGLPVPVLPMPALEEEARGSATRTITTHALVGTGTGLLIGWALSGANVSGDDGSLVLIWGSIGLGSGLLSGVITWLLE
ncbi:MAG TPA: hypothetical protein VFQ22_09020 [Longimicrobiales bacterium]|nr:hypothetical protein [Longimicrobiales bacterium]